MENKEITLEIKRHSEDLYKTLCDIVGSEDVVKFNRVCSKIYPARFHPSRMHVPLCINKDQRQQWPNIDDKMVFIDSGSRAEGFNFQSSDFDVMVVLKDFEVIQDPRHWDRSKWSFVLMEKCRTRPGFVRLRVDPHFSSWHVWGVRKLGQNYYLLNNKFKERISSQAKSLGLNWYIHGPCVTGESMRYGENDLAVTLASKTWPIDAVACVHRLLKCGWPSVDVIQAMVNEGCLFVPIGCRTSPNPDVEWRMSFSLAEKRLVCSMNHIQFLSYALLKLFLKETIEEHPEVKGLLCSYFMKTLVFWEIIETKVPWTPSYLLQQVWNCFRRLLSWVNNEHCPNFFIPENNMFHGKIYGRTRSILLNVLCEFYTKGYLMFYDVPSIRRKIDECKEVPTSNIRHRLRRSVVIRLLSYYLNINYNSTQPDVYKALESSQSNIILEFSDFLRLNQLNISLNRKLCSEFRKDTCNKMKYLKEKSLSRLIMLSSPDCVRGKIFLALFLYRCKRYDQCILLLQKVRSSLRNAETMYVWNFDSDRYSSLGGDEFTIIEGMRRFTASNVPLDSEMCIPEISEECSTPAFVQGFHYVPPFVMTHFLLFLCYFWKRELSQARGHLKTIHHCCYYSTLHQRANTQLMSFEILGICQETIGDFRNALLSFEECAKSDNIQEIIAFRLLRNGFLDVNKKRRDRIKAFFNMK